MIEFGIYNSGRVGATASFSALKQVWLEAERLGLEYAFCADNVVGPVGPGAESTEVIDFWSVAGAIAEATTRLRIGPLRPILSVNHTDSRDAKRHSPRESATQLFSVSSENVTQLQYLG